MSPELRGVGRPSFWRNFHGFEPVDNWLCRSDSPSAGTNPLSVTPHLATQATQFRLETDRLSDESDSPRHPLGGGDQKSRSADQRDEQNRGRGSASPAAAVKEGRTRTAAITVRARLTSVLTLVIQEETAPP